MLSLEEQGNMAVLCLIDKKVKNHTFELLKKETVVGRVKCGITIKDRSISRKHAKIISKSTGFEIEDLNSRNGTFINGKKVHHSILCEGDYVRLGKKLFLFQSENSLNPSSSESKPLSVDLSGNIVPIDLPEDDKSIIGISIKNAVDTIFRILTKAESVTIHLFKNNAKDLYCFTSKHRTKAKDQPNDGKIFSTSILKYASKEGKTVSAEDAQNDRRFDCTDSITKWKIKSVVCTPIIAKKRLAGIIQAHTSRPNYKFTTAEMALMDFVGSSLSVVIENIMLNDTVREQEYLLQKSLKQMETTQNILMHNDKLALVGKLSTGILHDVKNPLGAMLGYTGLVEEMVRKNQDQIQHYDEIKDNLRLLEEGTSHCYELINQILDFARQKPEPTTLVNINEIMETTAEFLSYELNRNHVELTHDLNPEIPLIKGHRNQLKQIFINLIINAIQAKNKEKNNIKIKTTCSKSKKYVVIKIKDNGSGMPEDVCKRIFQPFFTTKNSANQSGGTGLGLTVCKEIIRLHGGTIKVKSAPRKGTMFTIKLPAN